MIKVKILFLLVGLSISSMGFGIEDGRRNKLATGEIIKKWYGCELLSRPILNKLEHYLMDPYLVMQKKNMKQLIYKKNLIIIVLFVSGLVLKKFMRNVLQSLICLITT